MSWSLVIFACRESLPALERTLAAAVLAGRARLETVDVMVNGNPALAASLARVLRARGADAAGLRTRVWSIERGDKANAWNEYVHRVWQGEALAFFIDGYVRLQPDALALLGGQVTADARYLGGTGVPTVGHTAAALRAQLLREGGFHGNFCCMVGDTLAALKRRQIRLPLGLYRVDSLMGALMSFRLQPEAHAWDPSRIAVHPTATWEVDAKHWWRWSDLRSKLARLSRQAVGSLENAAVREHLAVRQCPPEALPATAVELVSAWAARCPQDVQRVVGRSPIARRALAGVLAAPRPGNEGLQAALLADTAAPAVAG